MNIERSLLIGFFGNYLINTVVVALVALLGPAAAGASIFTPQYMLFIALAAVLVAVLTWWHFCSTPHTLKNGISFGVIGFVVAIVTSFITGIAGVLAQTGSLSSVLGVLPNFWPFIANWSTLIIFGYWVIPSVVVGMLMQKKAMSSVGTQNPM